MSNIGKYAKAIVAAVIPGLVTLGGALLEASDGGSGVTASEWVQIALAVLVTGGVVGAVPNAKQSDPPPVVVVDPNAPVL
jgi:hypothetical protein